MIIHPREVFEANTIWKFLLYAWEGAVTELTVPKGAKFIHVAAQDEALNVWALVDNQLGRQTEDRRLVVHGTGHNLREDLGTLHYIGTAQIRGYVWHVFDAREDEPCTCEDDYPPEAKSDQELAS